ncbi:MAG: hypothetical protein KIT84_27670 [Labilithrix sp.]|nr:hypothetical protein [Labilithrix sp.]MCW5814838.1 hypothetical protein [Labilithrix sp.]
MAIHAPHVRTKRPLHGRRAARPALLARPGGSAATYARSLPLRFARRGPRLPSVTAGDLAFRVAAGGVMLAAMLLGVILGVTHPTWMLAFALLGTGALLATFVVVRSRVHLAS